MRSAHALRLLFLALLTLAAASASAQSDLPAKVIGFSFDRSRDRQSDLFANMRDELRQLMGHDFDLQFPEQFQVDAGGNPAGAARANDLLLQSSEVDLVIAFGLLVSSDLAHRTQLPKPSLAMIIIDAEGQGIPRDETGASGIDNLVYVEPVFSFADDMARFRELASFRRLAMMADAGFAAANPTIGQRLAEESPGVELVSVEGAMDEVLASLPSDVDAVYLTYRPHGREGEYRALADSLTARGIPTFSGIGEPGVKQGALVGLAPESWMPRLLRRAALLARRMLFGENGGVLGVQMTREQRLFINMETARRLEIYPSFDLMTEAVLIGELTREPERTLDLTEAMEQSVLTNRDLEALRREVEAGSEDVAIARSVLLPQVDVGVGGRLIDEDRASLGSFGAERTLSGRAGFSQILWSERAWAQLGIQKDVRRSLDALYRQNELDVMLQAASAYFNVLRSNAEEQIQRENVALTRSNLERARSRVRAGAASSSEVYRWEAQIAADRDALVSAIARRNVSEIELNRVLNLPLESKTGVLDPNESDGIWTYVDPRFEPFVANAQGLRRLRAFASALTLQNAPEMAQLDAVIAAQERFLASTNWAFFSPDVVLDGSWIETLDRGGKGADDYSQLPIDDSDWEVNLGLSLPIFNGGRRFSERSQAKADLARLEYEREALAERLEQRTRSAVHLASASFTRIKLTTAAEESSRKNFELVSDAYERGAVTIIELLDAQNALVRSSQGAATAVYQFLDDIVEVERAVGEFLLLLPLDQRMQTLNDLEAFVESRNGEEQP